VRLFGSGVRQGTYNIRNALARKARGRLLTFHDADDLALPARIARQVEAMQREGTVAATASVLRINPAGQFVFFKDQKASRLAMVSLLVRREVFEASGGFRSALFGADLELYE
jgi:hypothetical protein